MTSNHLRASTRYQTSHGHRHISSTMRSRTHTRVPSQGRRQRPYHRAGHTTYRTGPISRTHRSRRTHQVNGAVRSTHRSMRRHSHDRRRSLTSRVQRVTHSKATRRERRARHTNSRTRRHTHHSRQLTVTNSSQHSRRITNRRRRHHRRRRHRIANSRPILPQFHKFVQPVYHCI